MFMPLARLYSYTFVDTCYRFLTIPLFFCWSFLSCCRPDPLQRVGPHPAGHLRRREEGVPHVLNMSMDSFS